MIISQSDRSWSRIESFLRSKVFQRHDGNIDTPERQRYRSLKNSYAEIVISGNNEVDNGFLFVVESTKRRMLTPPAAMDSRCGISFSKARCNASSIRSTSAVDTTIKSKAWCPGNDMKPYANPPASAQGDSRHQ